MKLATSPLKHKPIRAKLIRKMWGRDEIGLFNSLYRNMLMQDNDSLIACYYSMYCRPNMKMQPGTLVRQRNRLLLSGTVLLTSILLRFNED